VRDILFLAVVAAFFAAAVALSAGCAWIVGGSEPTHESNRR
jgi:hypothetical protein